MKPRGERERKLSYELEVYGLERMESLLLDCIIEDSKHEKNDGYSWCLLRQLPLLVDDHG